MLLSGSSASLVVIILPLSYHESSTNYISMSLLKIVNAIPGMHLDVIHAEELADGWNP